MTTRNPFPALVVPINLSKTEVKSMAESIYDYMLGEYDNKVVRAATGMDPTGIKLKIANDPKFLKSITDSIKDRIEEVIDYPADYSVGEDLTWLGNMMNKCDDVREECEAEERASKNTRVTEAIKLLRAEGYFVGKSVD